MIHELKEWLTSAQVFDVGLRILQALHTSGNIDALTLNLCRRGKNAFTIEKMRVAIEQVVQRVDMGEVLHLKTAFPDTSRNEVVEVPTQAPAECPVDLPADIQGYDKKNRELYRQNHVYRGELYGLFYGANDAPLPARSVGRTKSRRETLAAAIVNNQLNIIENWKRFDYFTKNGVRFPGTHPDEEVRQVALWLKNKNTMIEYLRQAEVKHRKKGVYDDPTRVQQYRDELEKIEDYINRIL
jgi:hypothetical protein